MQNDSAGKVPDLRAPHAVAAVVAEVAVAVPHGDGAAVVAAGGVELEAGELLAADGGAVAVDAELGAGPLEEVGIGLLSRAGVAVGAVGVTVATLAVSVASRTGCTLTRPAATLSQRERDCRSLASASGLCG